MSKISLSCSSTTSRKRQMSSEKTSKRGAKSQPISAKVTDIFEWDHSIGRRSHCLVREYVLPDKIVVIVSELDSNRLPDDHGRTKVNSINSDFVNLANSVAEKYDIWGELCVKNSIIGSDDAIKSPVEWIQHFGPFSSHESNWYEILVEIDLTFSRNGPLKFRVGGHDEVLSKEEVDSKKKEIEISDMTSILNSPEVKEAYLKLREASFC
jgi:hypothetical protein